MSVLITGSKGYIGSRLCQRMKEHNIEFVEFDIRDNNDIRDFKSLRNLCKNSDVIIHLAGMVGMDLCKDNPKLSFDINVEGTENVISCGKPIIFTGVLAGYNVSGIVDEDTPVVAKNEYYVEKKLAEDIVIRTGNAIVLRLGSLYGVSPNMRWDLLVHNLISEAIKNGELNLFQPDVMRPISNIDDVCNAIMVFAHNHEYIKHNCGIYNVVSMNTTKRNMAKCIHDITGCEVKIVDKIDPEGRNYTVSTEKIRKLDFQFFPNFIDSVKEVVEKAKEEFN